VPALVRVLETPEVARWWDATDAEERLRAEMAGRDVATFVVEAGGALAGLIQYHEENDPDYRHAGIDIALHPAFHGRGLGTDAVHTLARHLVRDRGHHRLTIDPAAGNAVAIRCYSRVGFRPVGVMRRYERGPDGTWHDGLLMDLLAEELTGAGDARVR
jgi:aminoglycoside 6'-N-acetyltransferase